MSVILMISSFLILIAALGLGMFLSERHSDAGQTRLWSLMVVLLGFYQLANTLGNFYPDASYALVFCRATFALALVLTLLAGVIPGIYPLRLSRKVQIGGLLLIAPGMIFLPFTFSPDFIRASVKGPWDYDPVFGSLWPLFNLVEGWLLAVLLVIYVWRYVAEKSPLRRRQLARFYQSMGLMVAVLGIGNYLLPVLGYRLASIFAPQLAPVSMGLFYLFVEKDEIFPQSQWFRMAAQKTWHRFRFALAFVGFLTLAAGLVLKHDPRFFLGVLLLVAVLMLYEFSRRLLYKPDRDYIHLPQWQQAQGQFQKRLEQCSSTDEFAAALMVCLESTFGVSIRSVHPVVEFDSAVPQSTRALLEPLMKGFVNLYIDELEKFRLRGAHERQAQMATLGKLSSSILHEIKNPLNGVGLWLQELKGRISNDADRAVVERVVSGFDQVQNVARNALGHGRAAETLPSMFSAHACIHEVLELIAPFARKHHVEIFADLRQPEAQLYAVRSDIRQALLNLVLNAIEAMGDGGVLKVACHQSSGHVEVSVADTGPGIAPENLPLIFTERFTTKFTGNGLGLAVTKKMVESNRGHIHVESAPEWGATFKVRFPTHITYLS